MSELLGSPAVCQIVSPLNKGDNDEQSLIEKIESSCKKFDHSGKGYLPPGFWSLPKFVLVSIFTELLHSFTDEYFNVLKLQNGVDIRKDEV